MAEFSLMSYNVKWMNNMFRDGKIKSNKVEQAASAAEVIKRVEPHIVGVCEAANERAEHEHFIEHYLDGKYRVAMKHSRGAQNLVYYYREPVQLAAVDESFSQYGPWQHDADDDGIDEQFHWEREPLEAVFRLGPVGPKLRAILVHTKSKIVASVVDLQNFQKHSLANRKKLIAQARPLRSRIETLMRRDDAIPLVVMGDMNGGPGMDAFERTIGSSFVETVMGSIFEPDRILHNVLHWMAKHKSRRIQKDLWTAEFRDPIVSSRGKHRVWLDHIVLSPDLRLPGGKISYVEQSGTIGEKDAVAKKASDHFPVHCTLKTG